MYRRDPLPSLGLPLWLPFSSPPTLLPPDPLFFSTSIFLPFSVEITLNGLLERAPPRWALEEGADKSLGRRHSGGWPDVRYRTGVKADHTGKEGLSDAVGRAE